MRVDLYTKLVLTVIAVCLVWLTVVGRTVIPAVEAQDRTSSRVVIVGWEDTDGRSYPLPTKQFFDGRNRDPEAAFRFGVPIPVDMP